MPLHEWWAARCVWPWWGRRRRSHFSTCLICSAVHRGSGDLTESFVRSRNALAQAVQGRAPWQEGGQGLSLLSAAEWKRELCWQIGDRSWATSVPSAVRGFSSCSRGDPPSQQVPFWLCGPPLLKWTAIITAQLASTHESRAFSPKLPRTTHRASEATGPRAIILSCCYPCRRGNWGRQRTGSPRSSMQGLKWIRNQHLISTAVNPKHMEICASFVLVQGMLEYFVAENKYVQTKVNSSSGRANVEGRFDSFLEAECMDWMCVSPRFIQQSPNLQCDGVWRWSLWDVVRFWLSHGPEGGMHDGITVLLSRGRGPRDIETDPRLEEPAGSELERLQPLAIRNVAEGKDPDNRMKHEALSLDPSNATYRLQLGAR